MAGKERAELQYLRRHYEKPGSQLIVLYGQKHTGMTEMTETFCQGKPVIYYKARPCSERQQLFLWGNELREMGIMLPEYPSYPELFVSLDLNQPGKKVIIIEEFQYIVKQSQLFMPSLVSFLHGLQEGHMVMVVLSSTSIGWVESSMVQKIGGAALAITGFLKMKEQSFFDMVRYFAGSTREQQVETYAVLGGFPGLWRQFDKELSVKENICRFILRKGSFLHEEAPGLVARELRETGVYDTILSALACGKQKLNELYIHTGFSRAKISVYLKNLMELEIVEKVFSFETEGKDNTKKGVYRIQNHLIYFYFRYLYPHMSRLAVMKPEDFYDTYIAPDFRRFTAFSFVRVCREYMAYLNQGKRLPCVYTRMGEWAGKAGDIDMVAQDEAGHTLIALCSWEKPVMSFDDYEWLLFCARKARLQADHIYLFSAERFDNMLLREAEAKNSLHLIGLHSF